METKMKTKPEKGQAPANRLPDRCRGVGTMATVVAAALRAASPAAGSKVVRR